MVQPSGENKIRFDIDVSLCFILPLDGQICITVICRLNYPSL